MESCTVRLVGPRGRKVERARLLLAAELVGEGDSLVGARAVLALRVVAEVVGRDPSSDPLRLQVVISEAEVCLHVELASLHPAASLVPDERVERFGNLTVLTICSERLVSVRIADDRPPEPRM